MTNSTSRVSDTGHALRQSVDEYLELVTKEEEATLSRYFTQRVVPVFPSCLRDSRRGSLHLLDVGRCIAVRV